MSTFDEEDKNPQPKATLTVYLEGKRRGEKVTVRMVHGEGEDDGKHQKTEGDVTGDQDEEDELVDPQVKLRECCGDTEACSKLRDTLQECNTRVNSKVKTAETCEQELYDYLHCVDLCVTPQLFHYLK